MRLRSMNLIVLPPQALSDTKTPPFLFVEDLKGPSLNVKIVLGDRFEHLLGKHDVPVLVGLVGVAVRVMDQIDKLVKALSLGFREHARAAIAGTRAFFHGSVVVGTIWVERRRGERDGPKRDSLSLTLVLVGGSRESLNGAAGGAALFCCCYDDGNQRFFFLVKG